jgi:site-specific DNA-methyltransferase (adenine-specific)
MADFSVLKFDGRSIVPSESYVQSTGDPVSQPKARKVSRPDRQPVNDNTIFEGDALTALQRIEDSQVQCIITSPPYWGLRDYNTPEQIGLEPTLPQFIHSLVGVFREARRVLRDDGVLWINIGDGYTSGNRGWRAPDKKNKARAMSVRPDTPDGLKPKRSAWDSMAVGIRSSG